jgi:hypothetical protein
MKQELAFQAAAPPTERFGLRVEGGRLQEWLSASEAGFSDTAIGFLEPLIFKQVEPKSIGSALFRNFGKNDLKPSPTARTVIATEANTVVARLFDARANAKMVVAQVSMHLSPDWRAKIYRQVDSLLDVEDWQASDGLPDVASMKTFLRFVIYAGVTTVPSLGVAPNGNVLTAWRADTRRLTIEFQPNDRCRIAISHSSGDDTSIITYTGSTVEARSFLTRVEFPIG